MIELDTIEDIAVLAASLEEGSRVVVEAEGYRYNIKAAGGRLKFYRDTPDGWRYLYSLKI
jgi:hypothetical protein